VTLLEIVREFCSRTALVVPLTVKTSQDEGLIQVAALCNEVLDDLVTRRAWTMVTRQAVFTSIAAEVQGSLTTLAPFGYQGMINETFYDRDRRLPFFGPIKPSEWQYLKSLPNTGPYYKYRLWQNQLYLNPVMEAGHECAFEYYSDNLVADPVTLATPYKRYFTLDTDTFQLDDSLLLLGLRWMWKKEKGLAYSEEFRLYESILATQMGRDGSLERLSMASQNYQPQPGIFVPAGNWMVS
jgi:hypothetical protein